MKLKKGMKVTRSEDGKFGKITHLSGDGEIITIEYKDGKEEEIPKDAMKDKFDAVIGLKGRWTFEIHDAKTGKLKRVIKKDNLIPTVGKTAHAAQMVGGNSTDIGDNLFIALE